MNNFIWALNKLKDGRKIAHKSWPDGEYVVMHGHTPRYHWTSANGVESNIVWIIDEDTLKDMLAYGWMINPR